THGSGRRHNFVKCLPNEDINCKCYLCTILKSSRGQSGSTIAVTAEYIRGGHEGEVTGMISWIESKETAVIALIVFGIYYAVTAVIFVVAAILHKRERAAHLKATSPVMLTPLSV